MALVLMYITNNDEMAICADDIGVDRIWIDLETLGKADRQCNMDTVKSNHSITDISRIKSKIRKAELLVRINPWNVDSRDEIEHVINAGADRIMLPMWKNTSEVEQFLGCVNGRAKTTLLLETREAVDCLDSILRMDGIDEIHIGLNDLHLSYKMSFMFEPLANGLVEEICKKIQCRGISYGFGGVAKLGTGTLPAEKILQEHYRLGSSRVILSRSFFDMGNVDDFEKAKNDFVKNVKELRKYEEEMKNLSEEQLEQNSQDIKQIVADILRKKRK